MFLNFIIKNSLLYDMQILRCAFDNVEDYI